MCVVLSSMLIVANNMEDIKYKFISARDYAVWRAFRWCRVGGGNGIDKGVFCNEIVINECVDAHG